MTDESCDRAYYSEDEANRYADAVGETVDYLQMSDGLEPELRRGFSFFDIQMFRDGTPWGHPQRKSNRFQMNNHFKLNGLGANGLVLELYCWGLDEADALLKANTLRLKLIEQGSWPESVYSFAPGHLEGEIADEIR